MSNKIKTRFAPSPTGYLHIGGIRTALYSYIFAKQNLGKMILRIEDTDQTREVTGAVESLIQTMQKMSLKWDEGPQLNKSLGISEKGQNQSYFQSKRLKIYQEYAKKLIDNGKAYYCTCSKARLDELRQEQMAKGQPPKYDGHCRNQINNETKNQINNETTVIRLKIPEQGNVLFNDMVRGEVSIDCSEIDDQILIKSDGFATYHLASVVDDHLMGITHVIRGEDWLPSTPKHILLYQAFGWQLPEFAHLPLLLNPDKSKLSKRQGDVAVEDFLAKGYLPEALINYTALMGWHPQDNQEIFSLKELIKHFDLKRVQKAGAIFDLEKLNWFNCHYIKQKPVMELLKLCQSFVPDTNFKTLKIILQSQKERLITISDIKELIDSLTKISVYQPNLLIYKKSSKEKTSQGLRIALNILTEQIKWDVKIIKSKLEQAVKENNLTNGDLFWPVRVALSGQEKSPPPEEIMEIIGKKESLARISAAVKKL